MRPTGCPKTSVNNYHSTLRNISEECRSHLNHDGCLKSTPFLVTTKKSTVQDKLYDPGPPTECLCFNAGALALKCPELNSITCRYSQTSPLITQPMAHCPVQLITWAFRIRTAYGHRDPSPPPYRLGPTVLSTGLRKTITSGSITSWRSLSI